MADKMPIRWAQSGECVCVCLRDRQEVREEERERYKYSRQKNESRKKSCKQWLAIRKHKNDDWDECDILMWWWVKFGDRRDVWCVTDVRVLLMFDVSFLLERFPHCGEDRGGAWFVICLLKTDKCGCLLSHNNIYRKYRDNKHTLWFKSM